MRRNDFFTTLLLALLTVLALGCSPRKPVANTPATNSKPESKSLDSVPVNKKTDASKVVDPHVVPASHSDTVTSPDRVPLNLRGPKQNPDDTIAQRIGVNWNEKAESQIAAEALGRIGPAAVPQLVQALGSSNPETRVRSIEVLGRLGPDAHEAVPALIERLDDEDSLVRKAAARTLGRIGPAAEQAIPRLLQILLEEKSTSNSAEPTTRQP